MPTEWLVGILKLHIANAVAGAQLEQTHREIRELEQELFHAMTTSVPPVNK